VRSLSGGFKVRSIVPEAASQARTLTRSFRGSARPSNDRSLRGTGPEELEARGGSGYGLEMEDAMSSADQGASGAWIFLSHSHLDLVKVRRIRDAFEARAHNPLMFFLKALDDGSELDDLIGVRSKLEHGSSSAKARMRGPHAGWQQEVEIITSLDGNSTRSSISTTISKRRWSGSWFAASFGTGAFLEHDTERERAAGEPPSEPKRRRWLRENAS
jgi:hypothetical protein